MSHETVALSAIRFDKSVYPRTKHDPALVQRYAACLAEIEAAGNYITVDANLRMLDGRHRHLAYLTIYSEEPDHQVTVHVLPVSDDSEAFEVAAKLNSQSGWQMTEEDKEAAARRMYQQPDRRKTQAEIGAILSVSTTTVSRWLTGILEAERKAREAKMLSMWLACHTQEDIAEAVGVVQSVVAEFLQRISEKYSGNDSDIFRNFDAEPEEGKKSPRQLYSVWNFPEATNKTRVFGSIPPEIIDNLLYYYTKPFDVVFDPFGGGGSTVDKCIERKRRYYVSDLNPIPARSDIRKHDITTGLPGDLPVPDFVFLDPPYWKQAEGKYSQDPTDLGNLKTVEEFIEAIGRIAQQAKRKWNGVHTGRLALILGPCKQDGAYTDLAFLAYARVAKYLNPVQRIIVPYTTQVHGGAYVEGAKKKKELLYLHRDLMVFGG